MGTFKDSLKKWFYTNSSSAASSDARIPLLTATGEPKGSDTMDNIASVLGVIINGANIQYDSGITDLNNVSHRYIWTRFTSKPTNSPSGLNANGGFLLHVAINQASNKVQFMFDYNGAHGFFRTYWGSSWNAWVTMF